VCKAITDEATNPAATLVSAQQQPMHAIAPCNFIITGSKTLRQLLLSGKPWWRFSSFVIWVQKFVAALIRRQ
jgi:hypothetical protein